MIDLQKLSEVLNKHGVKCEYLPTCETRIDRIDFQGWQSLIGFDDLLNAKAATIIREAFISWEASK